MYGMIVLLATPNPVSPPPLARIKDQEESLLRTSVRNYESPAEGGTTLSYSFEITTHTSPLLVESTRPDGNKLLPIID